VTVLDLESRSLVAAVERDVENRARHARAEIEFVEARGGDMAALVGLLERGELPERVVHNDAKLNNVMIDDETGEAVCVIDLDTVMPGLSVLDFGDAVRSGASPAAEDERDLSKVHVDLHAFDCIARGYLEHRGIRPETAKRFRLGFAPGGNRLRGEARKRSWSEDDMVKAGLLVERGEGLTDYFIDRLIFPIMSISGRVTGFGGRVLDEREPKYMNSTDTPIYRKGDNLYGAFQAKAYIREEAPLLVEGNFDLLALANVGVNNVVAPLGTALTPNQGSLLRRYNRRVVVCFDGDEAGHKAARAAVEVLLRSGCEPQVALLPKAEDPDSYVREHGKADFQRLVANAVDLVDFVLAGRKFRTVPDERASLRELVALLRLMSDDAAVELYANRIAERFRVERDTVLRAARREGLKKPRAVAASSPELEERIVAAAVQDSELARAARDMGVPEIVADERLRVVARIAAEHCEEPGFGPAQILDAIEDESLRRRVAGWTFQQDVLPGVTEYRARVARMRATWLHGRILQAHAHGDGAQAEALTKERGELLREAAKERSSRS